MQWIIDNNYQPATQTYIGRFPDLEWEYLREGAPAWTQNLADANVRTYAQLRDHVTQRNAAGDPKYQFTQSLSTIADVTKRVYKNLVEDGRIYSNAVPEAGRRDMGLLLPRATRAARAAQPAG